jgi:5-amino-6-(5-phosphoribosylamino)uracil reductase
MEYRVTERPYVLLSAASSVDGYIDDTTSKRLLLSNDADFDRVDEVRASTDAILVGANTIRRDNPRLLVRSASRRDGRIARGLPESPIKVTLTSSGDLDPAASFFAAGQTGKIVYAASPAIGKARERLASVATVVDAGDPPSLPGILADLAARGVRRLIVEGGGMIHTQFLAAGLANEIHLVIAPFFVGDPAAPRFTGDGAFPHHPGNRMELAEVRQIGDVVFLRYLLSQVTHAAQI